jgi:PAS domain S-box-containing protein
MQDWNSFDPSWRLSHQDGPRQGPYKRKGMLRLGRAGFLEDLAVAALLVASVSGLRLLLAPVLHDHAAFLLYGLVVMICSWMGGLRVGLIATVLAAIAGDRLFVTPFAEINPMQHVGQVVLFVISGAAISLLAGQLRAARFKAEHEAQNATRSRAELADLVESIDEGFQAFDPDFKLTFMNRAADKILGGGAEQSVGKTFWDQFPGMDPGVEELLRRVMVERVAGSCETYYQPRGRWFGVNVYPFRNGISVLFNDISDRKNAQSERERLIGELQDALANIRTLRGLIPICAWCKRIRNDRGYWEQLELYLRDHSDAEFTHGMCPACLAKYSET